LILYKTITYFFSGGKMTNIVAAAIHGLQRWLGLLMAGCLLLTLNGCASYYVDGALKELTPGNVKTVAQPKPVQLFYEFQTKGVANSNATALTKEKVITAIKNTKAFSDLAAIPVPDQSTLSIVINNVPLTDDVFSRGFLTGFTFGAVGSKVSDGYVCTINYSGGEGAPKISKALRHAIHTTLGAAATPENVVAAPSLDEAVSIMVRQIISNGINDLVSDPTFK
jgi:hypothetical protein